ncbi:glycoside hydrolase family 3 C-terminal domain-containing protein, partial [candidate division KSB1 bacterium]|nr:glycoside hydrolase family 3 C-terminal domain-containing protein [candidate division KSB1 bacterium]
MKVLSIKRNVTLYLIFWSIFLTGIVVAQTPEIFPYQDNQQPIDIRVDDLLNRMTLEEKVDLLSGKGNFTKRNVRLGIPQFVITDGPLGPNSKGKATNYSASINMAATFDDELIHKVAENIGEETRVLGFNMLLAPCINIARVPFGGRTFESFGEDPYLMSKMAVAFVKGVQSKKVATCTKHYACNNQEWNRFDVDARVDERTLREIYLPAFKAVVQDADGWTIMAAYNQALSHYCCENKYLLTEILKNEWGFKGVAVTDWGGARSTVKMANSGMDLEMPTGKFYNQDLVNDVKYEKVGESIINDKVRRILRVMYLVGLFDESVGDYGGFADTPERRELALQVARKSIVLLKNENNFLPLDKKKILSIAVIGPNANVARMYGSGSGSLKGHYGVSPFEGIKNKMGSKAKVTLNRGVPDKKLELPIANPSFYTLDNGNPGIRAEYFNNRELEGEPVFKRIESAIDFDWGYGTGRPDDEGVGSPDPVIVNTDKWSARWTGKFNSPGDGWYEIGMQADNGVRLFLDNKLIIDAWTDAAPGKFKIVRYKFQAERKYDIKVEFYENWGSCRCKLGIEKYNPGKALEEAVELAGQSEFVILCLGLDHEMEGEALDRTDLNLPEDQEELIRNVTAVNKNLIVVLNNATPILMNQWINKVPVIIDALYPGQEGGNALAEIIFGEVCPSGRLPLTFPKHWEDCPAYKTYPGEKAFANYDEGIFVGYRFFDKKNIEPLFPFGHGLSFTQFSYSDLKITPVKINQNDTITVDLKVINTGKMAGEEVVQLYIRDVKASVDREVKALKGFSRIGLLPGESKIVKLQLNKNDLSFYDVK